MGIFNTKDKGSPFLEIPEESSPFLEIPEESSPLLKLSKELQLVIIDFVYAGLSFNQPWRVVCKLFYQLHQDIWKILELDLATFNSLPSKALTKYHVLKAVSYREELIFPTDKVVLEEYWKILEQMLSDLKPEIFCIDLSLPKCRVEDMINPCDMDVTINLNCPSLTHLNIIYPPTFMDALLGHLEVDASKCPKLSKIRFECGGYTFTIKTKDGPVESSSPQSEGATTTTFRIRVHNHFTYFCLPPGFRTLEAWYENPLGSKHLAIEVNPSHKLCQILHIFKRRDFDATLE